MRRADVRDGAHDRGVEQDRDGKAHAHHLEVEHSERREDREHRDRHDRGAGDDAGGRLDPVRDGVLWLMPPS